MTVLADERVIVNADHRDIFGNAQLIRTAEFDYIVAAVVVRGENADGTLQLLDALRRFQFVTFEAVFAQGVAVGVEAVDAPLHDGLMMHEGVGPAASDGKQVVRRGPPDLFRRVADEDDVLPAGGKGGTVDIHHDRRDIGIGERFRRAFGVRYGYDEAVISVRDRGLHPCGGELLCRTDEPHIPFRRVAEIAEDAAQFLLSRDPLQPQRYEYTFHCQ